MVFSVHKVLKRFLLAKLVVMALMAQDHNKKILQIRKVVKVKLVQRF